MFYGWILCDALLLQSTVGLQPRPSPINWLWEIVTTWKAREEIPQQWKDVTIKVLRAKKACSDCSDLIVVTEHCISEDWQLKAAGLEELELQGYHR